MTDIQLLDQAYQIVLRGLMATGHAPHYTELADALGCPVEKGRQALHDLLQHPGVPGWLQPGTDYLAGFAPLTNIPTQYRVAIDGEPRWFGQ
jgi:hypothetical protein